MIMPEIVKRSRKRECFMDIKLKIQKNVTNKYKTKDIYTKIIINTRRQLKNIFDEKCKWHDYDVFFGCNRLSDDESRK